MRPIATITLNPSIDLSTATERVAATDKLRCAAPNYDAGGGGINVARVIKRLGGECEALYPAGGDLGQLLRRLVDAEGIASVVVGIDRETRLNASVTERASEQQYRFVLPGPELVEADWRACLDRFETARPVPDYVVASGSLPPGAPVDFYARLAATVRAQGGRLVLDTSGPPLAAALDEGVYLAKPNLLELAALVGRPLSDEADWRQAALTLVDAGQADVVALTLGERGAFLAAAGMRLRAPQLPVRPVSAVGAGDSFLGAMVWRLATGGGLEDAFRWGMAAGAAALLTADTGLCRQEDVERLYSQVSVLTV